MPLPRQSGRWAVTRKPRLTKRQQAEREVLFRASVYAAIRRTSLPVAPEYVAGMMALHDAIELADRRLCEAVDALVWSTERRRK